MTKSEIIRAIKNEVPNTKGKIFIDGDGRIALYKSVHPRDIEKIRKLDFVDTVEEDFNDFIVICKDCDE